MNEWLRTTWSRLRAAAARDRLDREFDEELATHLQLLVDEYRRKGLSDAVARREAIRRLGWPDALRESHRDERGVRLLDVLLHDLRYAVRALWRTPAFAAIALLSLALGIGANTALFSLIDDLLLRSLAVRQPHRLVQVQQVATIGPMRKVGSLFTAPVFDYVRARNDIFSEILGFSRLVRPIVSIDGSLEPHRQVDRVSANYFRDLGVTPAIGRTPQASDDDVAVVSDRFWRARFGAAPSLLGRSVAVDGKAYTVVGVAPRHFLGLIIEMPTDLWLSSRTPTSHLMIARLRPEITPAQAQAASQVLFRQLAGERPDVIPWIAQMRMEIVPAGRGLSQLRAQYERPLLAL
ncbi:MAG TPA: ABC transporter permease, partial [Vicinamibacterales bacterium]|nr:ABC transporter permease [Vicinamibacterales bacterium]